MADKSAIEWTDATWNPVRARNLKTGKVGWHCEHATTGCEFCYSEGFNKRLGTGLEFKPGHRKDVELFLDEAMLTQPLRWKKPRMIFVCSMTDLFADFVPVEWIDKMFAVMALCPQHTFQVLTKRAERMRDYFTKPHSAPNISLWQSAVCWATDDIVPLRTDESRRARDQILLGPLPNVWLGVSTERQQEADERIPLLMQTPAAVRFISAEPLLGPIDLTKLDIGEVETAPGERVYRSALAQDGNRLDWVIVGGESGPKARPMHPGWARDLRDQCKAAGVAFFFKQWGEHVHATQCDLRVEQPWSEVWIDQDTVVARVGKKAAGRHLDGVLHDAMPEIAR